MQVNDLDPTDRFAQKVCEAACRVVLIAGSISTKTTSKQIEVLGFQATAAEVLFCEALQELAARERRARGGIT